MDTLPELTVRRLALIRLMYQLAVEQSRRTGPAAATSILSFHDAVEFFLHLAMVHCGDSKKEPRFMDYWDLIDAKLKPDRLGQKEGMRRLNDIRGALKHQGVLPAMLEIESARASTTTFFDENTSRVFKVGFFAISLVDLVDPVPVQELLRGSQKAQHTGDLRQAMVEVASAFACLLDNSDLRTRPGVYGNPIGVGDTLRALGRPHLLNREVRPAVDAIVEGHNNLIKVVQELQQTTLISALGLDYRRYAKFRRLTPMVQACTFDRNGHVLEYRPLPWKPERQPSAEDLAFCFDFVIESALQLQRRG
jgi:hypothetical protein